MADDEIFELSRRKALAGLGTIGLASAGAGLGTSAFFSDTETFEGNMLVAGDLDLKIDWEEHYSDWSPDEEEFAGMGSAEDFDYALPALDAEGNLMTDGRPIWLTFAGDTLTEKDAAQDGLWDATSIEAFPDSGDNGIQDFVDPATACEVLGDVGDVGPGFTDALFSDMRTEGTVKGQTTNPGDPLINLDDVKPGDFGEVTFSFHLCDNPGYVWLNGELVSASENGHTEPEAGDPDTAGNSGENSGPEDLATSQVELLDAINTRVWYDDGDNQLESVRGELDIMLALDASGSIGGQVGQTDTEADNLVKGVQAFVDALPDDGTVQVGQVVFGTDITNFVGLGPVGGYSVAYPTDPDGTTALPAAIDIATQELQTNGRPGADNIVVVFTDGAPNYSNTSFGPVGSDNFVAPRDASWSAGSGANYNNAASSESEGEQIETALVAGLARNETRLAVVNVGDPPNRQPTGAGSPKALDVYLQQDVASAGFYFEVDLTVLAQLAANLVAAVAVGEELIVQGTLREALTILSGNDGRGIPLDGDRSTAFDEISDPENDPDRDCFAGEGTTHYVAFEWWLPVNHANQIQTDSVSFDLGFYTEQCRHNDGAGMPPEGEAA